MFGLALDENNDIILSGGSFKRTYDGAYTAQAVKTTVQLVQGESSVDEDAGIPYFSEVFVRPANIAQVESLLKTAILNIEGVNSLLSFESTFDTETRKYRLDFSADTDYGTIVLDDFTIGGSI